MHGSKQHPYVIHRTSVGCYERTLALLLEKYAGALPLWLSPTQVEVLPVSEKYADYAMDVAEKLSDTGIRVEVDHSSEKLGYKIRKAQLQKTPYILVVGEKEMTGRNVSVRSRKEGDIGVESINQFIEKVYKQVEEKTNNAL